MSGSTPTVLSRLCPACQSLYPYRESHRCPAGGVPVEGSGDPLIGVVVGERYQIEAELGRGGMGLVYRARHKLLGKPVALKLMLQATDGVARERFLREAQSASAIAHANIVGISDYGVLDDGRPFLVMEYLRGHTLDRVLARGPLPALRVCRIGRQLALGLQAVHDQRVVHRDLKPANVFLLDQDGEDFVKILDFGIAKIMTGERLSLLGGADADRAAGKLTRDGMILGTPAYMSPEQATGESVDPRADQYALGCILYEMLVGGPPIDGQSVAQILMKQVTVAPVPPRQQRPDLAISEALEGIILRALQKTPEARFPSMRELAQALQMEADRLVLTTLAAGGAPSTAALDPPVGVARSARQVPMQTWPRGSRRRVRGIGAGLLCLGGLLWLWARPRAAWVPPHPPDAGVVSARAADLAIAEPLGGPEPTRSAVASAPGPAPGVQATPPLVEARVPSRTSERLAPRRLRLLFSSSLPIAVRVTCGEKTVTLAARDQHNETLPANGVACVARAEGYRSATYPSDKLQELARSGKPLRVLLEPL